MIENKGVVLSLKDINKTFVTTKAVVNVSLDLYKGEIRGLIGENGSGKSTLSSIICGVIAPDSGTMNLGGKEHKPSNMLQGRENGVSVIVQEMGTINNLTVADNIFLGREDEFANMGFIDKKKMIVEASKLLESINAEYINPTESINNISFEDRKLIEVGIAMLDNPEMLILDETTTALSQKGRNRIYKIVKSMQERGKTVIFISHDLDEVMDVCNNITVLRDGCLIKTVSKSEVDNNLLKQLMIGRELTESYYREDTKAYFDKDVVLEVDNISYKNVLKDVSFKLHKGEIMGIGGLTECGMHELCKIVFGVFRPDNGSIIVNGDVKIKNAGDALKQKVGYIPKNREQEAMMLTASIKENVVLMALNKLKKANIITPRSENKITKEMCELMDIKMTGINQDCIYLSGGNKQKVVIAKWLANDSETIIMDCPTRGIDVGVKASIYSLMQDLKKQGKSIIMVSEELTELIGMSDRIIVLKNGSVTGEFIRDEATTEHEVVKAMI